MYSQYRNSITQHSIIQVNDNLSDNRYDESEEEEEDEESETYEENNNSVEANNDATQKKESDKIYVNLACLVHFSTF